MDTKKTREILTDLLNQAQKTIDGAVKGHDDFVPQFQLEADAFTAAIESLDRLAEYEEMMANVHKIECWTNGKEWDLRQNCGNSGAYAGKWFFRHALDTFYDSPLEAFRAIKEQAA